MFDSKFEFINIQKLVKQKTPLPSPFYCSLHPFKFIPYHTNPPGLWWPLPFIYLAAQPPPPLPLPPAYYSLYNSIYDSNYLFIL